MRFIYSKHWIIKQKDRSKITDDLLEFCILHSQIIKDKHWEDAYNAITRIPPSNRLLKVVYKIKAKEIKILTDMITNKILGSGGKTLVGSH